VAKIARVTCGLLVVLGWALSPSTVWSQTVASKAAPLAADYLIGSADVLQLIVWKEPELTRDVTVRVDGRITVPLLGDVDAAGKTPKALAEELQASLAKYLAAPQVTVGVSQPNSMRFYVIGMVIKPGDYPCVGQVSLVQALAQAGGFREFAKTDEIQVLRKDKGGKSTFLSVSYKKLESGKDVEQNIRLLPGDTIIVP
jgi:polysaccharide export outer membrane protein